MRLKIRQAIRHLLCLCAFFTLQFAPQPAQAQNFDPRPALATLISGFQNCGPPSAFYGLSPYVWQFIYQQTGGSGCYAAIAAAGPVTRMDVTDTHELPLGPVYVIRVAYAGIANYSAPMQADWFVGFNRATGSIEYLNFQAAGTGAAPTIEQGPDPSRSMGGVVTEPDPTPAPKPTPDPAPGRDSQSAALERACANFPLMCVKPK